MVKICYLGGMSDTPPIPSELPRLIPTGTCWCGCGRDAALGAFFHRGHDKKAEADLIAIHYGASVAQLLHAHGYGPGRSLHDHAIEVGAKVQCSIPGCPVSGTPEGIRAHLRRAHPNV